MKILIIAVILLFTAGCGIWDNPTGPNGDGIEGKKGADKKALVSYADVKSNYDKSHGDFPAYIYQMDNVEWIGKIISIDKNSKTTFHVGGSSSNPLILTVSSDLVAGVASKYKQTIKFQAKITNYTATGGSFTLTGKLIKVFPE